MSYYNGLSDQQENWMFAGGEIASGAYACQQLTAKLKAKRKDSDAGSPQKQSGEHPPTVPEPEGRSQDQP